MTISERWKEFRKGRFMDDPIGPGPFEKMVKVAFYAGVEVGINNQTYEMEWRDELDAFKELNHK